MNIFQLTKADFEQIYIDKFEFEYNNNIYNEYTDIINMKEFNENKVKYCIENFMNWIEYDTLNLLMFNEFEVKYILNQFYKTYYSSINSRSNYNKIKYAIINFVKIKLSISRILNKFLIVYALFNFILCKILITLILDFQ